MADGATEEEAATGADAAPAAASPESTDDSRTDCPPATTAGRRERTRGSLGNLTELPLPTVATEELAERVVDALAERGLSQTAVCAQLSLSPVYLSIWLKGKAMPDLTKQLYSSAIELWLNEIGRAHV